MDLFKYTKGIIDKAVGAFKLHAVQKNAGELLDPMQKYLTVGEYHVDARDATPDGRPFTLTVYQDDQGILHRRSVRKAPTAWPLNTTGNSCRN